MARVLPMLGLVLGLAGTPAFAQPLAVASGQDLAAWQSIEQQRLHGDAAVAAYRTFVQDYAASPLALVAWQRLEALDADVAWSDEAEVRKLVESLEERVGELRVERKRTRSIVRIELATDADDASASVR